MGKKIIVALLLTMFLMTQIVFAHGGRTDSNGGHRDNKNTSGLGSYHYHCGEYPAHLHNNGVCPYSNEASSESEPSYVIDTSEAEKEEARDSGYSAGYEAGLNGNSFNDANSSNYSSEYKSGYSNGYEKGKSELDSKIKNAYNEGYDVGYNGGSENNTYIVQVIKDSYSKGYREGLKVYIKENKAKYLQMAEEDASTFEMRILESSVPSELRKVYNEAFNSKTSELKKIAYDEGYIQALSMKGLEISKFKSDEEVASYNEGYNIGKKNLEEENNYAYECGYSEKEYSVPENLVVAENILLSSYNKGVETINQEKAKQYKVIMAGVGVLIVAGITGGVIIKKKKSN